MHVHVFNILFLSFGIFLFSLPLSLSHLLSLGFGGSHQNINSPSTLGNKLFASHEKQGDDLRCAGKNWINIKMVSELRDIRQTWIWSVLHCAERKRQKNMKTNRLSKCDGRIKKKKYHNIKQQQQKRKIGKLYAAFRIEYTFPIVYFLTLEFFSPTRRH